MLWNCSHSSNLKVSPEFVELSKPATLHRFLWLHDKEIGSIDKKWNWLVGEYEDPLVDVANIHWTIGGPYFDEYKNVDFEDEWFIERDLMANCNQIVAT